MHKPLFYPKITACDWLEASSAAQIEMVVIKWLADIFKLPATASGIFVSGGSMGNFMALVLAIHHQKQSNKIKVIYCSDQTHLTISIALLTWGCSFLMTTWCNFPNKYQ